MNIIRTLYLVLAIVCFSFGVIFNDGPNLQLAMICFILYRIYYYEDVLVVIDKNFDAVESRLKKLEEKQ